MRSQNDSSDTDRGQAYTLEGLIGAMVVLMAVLFALQSVVITPTTGGLADRTVQSQIQQEAQDALVVASQDGDLSEAIRNWGEDEDEDEWRFDGAEQPGPDGEYTYSPDGFAEESTFGKILKERFTDDGWSYNVELVYKNESEFNTTRMVYQGSPPSDAITASYTVTLYHSDTLVPEDVEERELEEAHEDDDIQYPIPPVGDDEEFYNTVEVRVVLW